MTAFLQGVEAARQTVLLLVHQRLVRLVAVLVALVAVAAVLVPDRLAQDMTGDDLFGVVVYLTVFQFALPTLAVYLGLAVLHGEIADRSAVHVFALPVHRASLLLGRWVAVAAFGAAATIAACGLWWLALGVGDPPWRLGLAPTGQVLGAFALGALLAAPGYAAVGALCGVTFRRPLIAAILFIVGWEVLVSNMPPQAGVRGWTIADPVRRMLEARIDPEPGSHLADLLTATMRGREGNQLGDPLTSVAWFTALFVGLALVIYTRRSYDARARD